MLQDQKNVIQRVKQDTVSICENRSLQLGLTADANGQASSENYSIFDSNIGDETFSFDDEIVNSFAYRNALKRLALKTKATQQNAKPDEHHILDEPLIDLEELSETHNGPRIKSTVTSSHQCLIPSKPFTHTVRLSKTLTEDLQLLLPHSIASPDQERDERHTDLASPLYDSGSPNSISANQSHKNKDAEKGIGQRVRAPAYHDDKAAFAGPLRHSRSTSITADTVEGFEKNATLRMARLMAIGAGCWDFTRSSTLSKNESSSLQGEGKPRVFSKNRNMNTYHSNIAPAYLGSTQAEAEAPRDQDRTLRRRRIRRDIGAIPSSPPTFGSKLSDDEMHAGQYGHESKTKASEDEGIFYGRLLVEHDYTNPENNEYDKTSIKTKSSRETKRKHMKRKRRRDNPTVEVLAAGGLIAAALQDHVRKDSSSNRDTRPGLSRQKSRERRVKNNGQDSGHDASLVNNPEIKGGDGVASRPSINANPRLLETVENAIRRLILPELESLRQEQSKKKGDQTPEPSHWGFGASSVTSADISHETSKHACNLDVSENPKLSKEGNNSDTCKDADLTPDTPHDVERMLPSTIEDGRLLATPETNGRSFRDKSRKPSDTSLLIEYFEGGKGPNVHSRPSIRVKKINDTNEHVQVTESKGSRKPSYTQRISLGPYLLEKM